MQDTPQLLADRLVQEGGRVVDFFNQLLSEQWSILVYGGQKPWSFHQLLAHFVSAEIARRELIDNVCRLGEGAPAGFEINRFNETEVENYSKFSTDKLISMFIIERTKLAETVSKLSADDLQIEGKDPFLGLAPLSEIIKLTYRHLLVHLREVRRYLE